MAGDQIGIVVADEVGGADGGGAEAQVRDGDGAGFLRVVDEIALGAQVGVLADDLDAVLVGAHRAIAAQPVEHRLEGARVGVGAEAGVPVQAGVRDVVVDADGEVVPGLYFSSWSVAG